MKKRLILAGILVGLGVVGFWLGRPAYRQWKQDRLLALAREAMARGDLREAGLARRDAILQAGRDRLRPILMTSLTTLLAMLPLALGDTQIGGDGPAYYPMARALISGLAFGAVVSLFFVPAFYVWLDDLNAWRRRVSAAAGSAPAAAAR